MIGPLSEITLISLMHPAVNDSREPQSSCKISNQKYHLKGMQDLGDWNSFAPTLLEADAYSPPPSPEVAQDNVSAAQR